MSGHDLDYDATTYKPNYPTKDEVKQRQAIALAETRQRIVDEQQELDTKLASLLAITKSMRFPAFPQASRDLLLEQCRVMQRYSMILEQRIAIF